MRPLTRPPNWWHWCLKAASPLPLGRFVASGGGKPQTAGERAFVVAVFGRVWRKCVA